MKWYEKGWVIFLLLLFVFPVGVFLLWKCGHWHKIIKAIATIFFGFVFLITAIIVSEDFTEFLCLVLFIPILVFIIYDIIKILKKYTSVFKNWDIKVHKTPEQRIRIYRALHDGLILHRFTDNESGEVVGKSGEIYEVTLHNCTCPDFEERQQPCKHMYFLAKELGKLSKIDLWLFSNKPKWNKNNKQNAERHSMHRNDFNVTVTSRKTDERPTKKVKLNYEAIDKIVSQKTNSFYGYTGIYDFKVRGTNVKTNRRKAIEVKATSQQEAEEKAEEQGIFPPYEVENILKKPSENQMQYAKYLKIKIPNLCNATDVSALISQVERDDTTLVSPEFLAFAQKRDCYISSFSGEKAAYDDVFEYLTDEEKIATFAFMLYKHITKDTATNFEDCRYKDKLMTFAQEQMENTQFMKSFERQYSQYDDEDDIFCFDSYTDQDGFVHQGINKKTVIYKTTFEFLKQNNMI